MGWAFIATPGPLNPEKDAVRPVQQDVWVPGPVWTDVGNFAPTGIRSLDRPARRRVAILTEISWPNNYCCAMSKAILTFA